MAPQVFLKNIKIISLSLPASRMCFRIKLDYKCDSSFTDLLSCWAQLYSVLCSLTYLFTWESLCLSQASLCLLLQHKMENQGITYSRLLSDSVLCYHFWVEMIKLFLGQRHIEKCWKMIYDAVFQWFSGP